VHICYLCQAVLVLPLTICRFVCLLWGEIKNAIYPRCSCVYADKPTAPLDLKVVDRHKDYVSMTWKAPKSDGGSLITGYVIERREGSRTTWTKVGETSSETRKYKATRLTEGTEYAFRVAAENSIGVGEFATIDKPVKADVSFG